jgi:hypothetical protein
VIGALPYLTLFRSRLGCVNLVLQLTSSGFTPDITLVRKLSQTIKQTASIDLGAPEQRYVVDYLLEKGFLKKSTGRGAKYRLALPDDWPTTPLPPADIQCVDMWMAAPAVRSTVGTPTVDNANEYIELAVQLGYLTKAKRNWTSTGQAVTRLRAVDHVVNPFVLDGDALLAFRQLLACDGLMLEPLLRRLIPWVGRDIPRDMVASDLLLPICEDALARARALRFSTTDLGELRDLLRTVQRTVAKRGSGSGGPGVLEHRVTPRLEWLVDLQLLDKAGPHRNSFTYRAGTIVPAVVAIMVDFDPRNAQDVDELALAWWRLRDPGRAGPSSKAVSSRDALRFAYDVTKRPVGPAAIRETVLIACARSDETLASMRAELLTWASEDPKVTVSGGRYSRSPELVHIAV